MIKDRGIVAVLSFWFYFNVVVRHRCEVSTTTTTDYNCTIAQLAVCSKTYSYACVDEVQFHYYTMYLDSECCGVL